MYALCDGWEEGHGYFTNPCYKHYNSEMTEKLRIACIEKFVRVVVEAFDSGIKHGVAAKRVGMYLSTMRGRKSPRLVVNNNGERDTHFGRRTLQIYEDAVDAVEDFDITKSLFYCEATVHIQPRPYVTTKYSLRYDIQWSWGHVIDECTVEYEFEYAQRANVEGQQRDEEKGYPGITETLALSDAQVSMYDRHPGAEPVICNIFEFYVAAMRAGHGCIAPFVRNMKTGDYTTKLRIAMSELQIKR